MTGPGSREIWARLEPELAPVDVGGRIGWVLRGDLPALRRSKLEEPVIPLLPSFDSFLLGVEDKSHLVDPAPYKRVYRPQGGLSPVVLVGGRLVGVWFHERESIPPSVPLTPLGR